MNRYKDLTLRYGDLFDYMAELFRQYAPTIGFDIPADGFAGEAAGVLSRFDDINSPDKLAEMMRSIFARRFTGRMAGPSSGYEPIARQFWAVCVNRGLK